MHFTRGNIGKAHTHLVKAETQTGKVIVFRFIEHTALNNRTGGHHADNAALDDALCGFRVFHLLTDCDLVAARNQFCDVAVRAVERHAAHRCALFLPAVTPC